MKDELDWLQCKRIEIERLVADYGERGSTYGVTLIRKDLRIIDSIYNKLKEFEDLQNEVIDLCEHINTMECD